MKDPALHPGRPLRLRRVADGPGPPDGRERRRRGDPMGQAVAWCAGLAWLLSVLAWLAADHARPAKLIFWDRWRGINARMTWDQTVLDLSLWLMGATLGICALGLALNSQRLKRRGDGVNFSLVVLTVASAVGIGLWFWLAPR